MKDCPIPYIIYILKCLSLYIPLSVPQYDASIVYEFITLNSLYIVILPVDYFCLYNTNAQSL